MTSDVEMDHGRIEELLGAYALDALDETEAILVEELLARDPEAARESDRLRSAAVWIGATEALAPPPSLRAGTLARLAAHTDERQAYGAETRRFAALLETIPDDALDTRTWNGLTVYELVAHMAAMESAAAEGVGAPIVVEAPDDIEGRSEVLATVCRGSLAIAREHWASAVDAVSAWADAGGEQGRFPWWDVGASRRTFLTARAFEHWTHGDDLRRALSRPLEAPSAGTISVMSDVAVGLLVPGLAMRGYDATGKVARVVLTGAGGGDWTIALDGGEAPGSSARPDVTVIADVVAFCRRVGDRVAASDLACTVDGDEALAAWLLDAASAFATL